MSITNYPDADFTPDIPNSGANTGKQSYNPTGSFRFWAQKVLPTVYDDSLSYYEILTKVVNYLNAVIQNVDSLNDSVDNTNSAFDALQGYVNATKDTIVSAYNELQSYVNTYFDSLDVQEEINAKLDDMASDGSLSEVVSPFIPSLVADWLSDNITPTSPAIDASLSVSGAGADAKVTGDEINNIKTDIKEIQSYSRNLFNPNKMIEQNVTVDNGVITGTAANLYKSFKNGIPLGIEFSEGTYILSWVCKNLGETVTGNGISFNINYTDGTKKSQYVPNSTTTYTEFAVASDSSKMINNISMAYSGAGDNSWEIKEIQLEKSIIQSEFVPYKMGKDSIARNLAKMSMDAANSASIAVSAMTDGELFFSHELFEIGNIVMNSKSVIYNFLNSRIRTKKSSFINLPQNAVISSNVAEFYVGHAENDTFVFEGWVNNYTTPIASQYYLLLRLNPETEVTDMDAILDSLKITVMTEEKDDFSELSALGASPFRFYPCYDHLFVNDSAITIPHESLYHVRLSAKMGFNMIEANIAKTSDDVYVVNHFNSGKFGRYFYAVDGTDISNTSVGSVTWDYIVSNIRYNSEIPKYRTRPSRLEEFLSECRQQNIIPFVQSIDSNVLKLADEYMGKYNYVAYGANRDDCPNGILYHWVGLTTKNDIVEYCKNIGRPFIYGMSNPNNFTEEELIDIVNTLHEMGYWIGSSYIDDAWYKYSHCGFDTFAGIKRINRIKRGNVCNIDALIDFSAFTYTNATETDGVLIYSSNGKLSPNFIAENLSIGGFDLEMWFDGEIVVPTIGRHGILAYTSDGSYPIFISAPIINGNPVMTLQPKSGTKIYNISYKVSKF